VGTSAPPVPAAEAAGEGAVGETVIPVPRKVIRALRISVDTATRAAA
jgi:hypothetical protein